MHINIIKNEINEFFSDYFYSHKDYNKLIYEAMYYSIKNGGKRIRPILCLLTYDLYNDDHTSIIPIAGAIEMIHTYSLIHDDLPCMDNDDLRRGKPTNHKVFGDGMAVLAGDALLNEAMNIMFNYCVLHGNAIIACKEISIAAGAEGMVGGQVVDILSEKKEIEIEELKYMHKKKTGALIKASIISGALLASAPSEDIENLSLFGEKLGLAFQIKDDILDIEGDEKKLGKSIKSDIENDKTTFVKKYGVEQCKRICSDLTNECFEHLRKIDKNTEKLEEITSFLLKRDY
ncbi:polyprenyl synthetase family protein [Clostridium sp. DL1XJH146]